MRTGTRDLYRERIQAVVDHILQHLGEPTDLGELAEVAGFSPFHFHRVFRGMLGEPLIEMVRRLRLEQAAYHLQRGASVGELALDAGYESVEAFTRAFRSAYLTSPTEYRKLAQPNHRLGSANGIHWEPEGGPVLTFTFAQEIDMSLEFRTLPAMRLAALRHVGPYPGIGATFGKLMAWAQQNGVPMNMTLATYYDDPDTTPPAQLQSDACLLLPVGYTFEDADVRLLEIPEHEYAIYTHVGSYAKLGDAWSLFYGKLIPASGREMVHGWCFERYIDDCAVVTEDQVRTEICQSVKPLS